MDDFFDFIKNKAIEYAHTEDETFTSALVSVEKDQYQMAYDTYKRLYYIARLKDDFHNSARALTEVSSIIAYTEQVDFAIQLASVAIQYADSYNIVDQTLKCQAYLNMGSIMKCYNVAKSLSYFVRCAQIAQSSGNSQFLFFALLGLAEAYLIMGDIQRAISYYEAALSLVNDTETALSIQKEMLGLYKHLIEQRKVPASVGNTKTKFKGVIEDIIKEVGKNLCTAALFKLLNLQGSSAIISIGTKYIIEKNIFHSTAVIGNNRLITQ